MYIAILYFGRYQKIPLTKENEEFFYFGNEIYTV